MNALLLGLLAAVVFVVLVGGVLYLLAPFAGQIIHDLTSAPRRQERR